jgi:homoserine O-succinyltransferase
MPGAEVTIGLVNNMPVAAFQATERQFVSLLNSASEGIAVRLLLYTLPGGSRTQPGGPSAGRYASVETLWAHEEAGPIPHLDALIVTGAEPIRPDLRDEAYWESFTRLVDWARANTCSAVWSCLAAHAAVLHMDGVGRRKRNAKLSGIYPCELASKHRLMAGSQPGFPVPHSRWNGMAESDLADHGYEVLARTAGAEVDTFVKEEQSLFVFFQGHPEYEADTLLREYRRDVGRYLRQEADTYPLLPQGYFDGDTEARLHALRERATSCNGEHSGRQELLHSLASVLEGVSIEKTWQASAVNVYRNWLGYLCERKNPGEAWTAGQPQCASAQHADRPPSI